MLAPVHPLRLVVVVTALFAGAALGSCFGNQDLWSCLDPATGVPIDGPYDEGHYDEAGFDPCHCYDPGGPEPQCPIAVDAGPGNVGDAGDAGPDAS